ncbi:Up-regulated during septation-domain-containing protein [Parachaetomium inaequale]|uniref:Up-regulated during septation-domain-containing protein n=1 Tax=Parachaetomium inaequale TaxID=2588326 RepID=A0AAN6PPS3_9PEZI|nr:Up-regulated during septation-domain-containing protein [Parachaetomium inaequale]
MAHIASCLLDTDQDDLSLGLNNYIAKAVSPQDSNELFGRASPSGDKPFAWRMQHPERKYQLFPKDKQAVTAPGKALDPEQAYALAMGQTGDKSEKMTAVTGLRIRIKEHNLIRRRKISVPELGPMTTVQEASMDSPTIPGRPPVHERSISAPGNSWKPYSLADCMTSGRAQPPDERPELRSASRSNEELQRPENELRQPLSPKSLTPLVIPTSNPTGPHLARQLSFSRLRSGSTPVEASTRPARTDDSPRARTPFTPLSASLTTPRSAATTVMTASTLPTPVSAPAEHRASPRPWEKPTNLAAVGTPTETVPERSVTPKAELGDPLPSLAHGHRRHQSESGSIMERGRPRKRSEVCAAATLKRTGSKRSKSSEKQAFEQLPRGWKASDAVNILSPPAVASLQKQALQQAARFEVLRKEDVDNLSRELRHLDERTEYLRHTYTSLRSGRRNLHTRICQYLRSPRTAKFSHESILKQEEALAELDTSIDEWVNKLEQAENRRTRVRQKLLEHVAAAATLGVPNGSVVGVSESLQFALGVVRPLNASLSTPPRSPVKTSFTPAPSSSPSPHRAQVPSTILEQPLFEEAASMDTKEAEKGAALRRAETIRVYADNDVYALLADVENTITKMGGGDVSAKDSCAALSDSERRKLCRTLSHDVLSGGAPARKPLPISKLAEKPSSASLSSAAAPRAAEPAADEIFLTSAVFKP